MLAPKVLRFFLFLRETWFLVSLIVSILSFYSFVGAQSNNAAAVSDQKLLVLLVDGFRWDYQDLDKNTLLGFQRLERLGVRAEYVTPIFPSSSYPNWYTIATGLYPESHGMVGNYMYDSSRNARFQMENTPPLDFWWNQAEPIWITTQRKGMNTAVLWWDGCQIPHQNIIPRICTAYKSPAPWKSMDQDTSDALVESLQRFQRNETKLEMVYYEKVDYVGHKKGVESVERIEAVRSADDIIIKLLDKIDTFRLTDQVNVVIVSDHGMTQTDGFKMVNLTNAFDPADVLYIVQQTAHVMIEPKPGRENKVLNDLMRAQVHGVDIYNKSTIPEMYHIKNNNRTFSIFIVARFGYFILTRFTFEPTPPGVTGSVDLGAHGWDPYSTRDMRAIFYAIGPAFKKGFRSRPIEMVDHYNTFCHVLGIGPLPNNGSWDRIRDMFVSPEKTQAQSAPGSAPSTRHSWTVLITFAILATYCTSR